MVITRQQLTIGCPLVVVVVGTCHNTLVIRCPAATLHETLKRPRTYSRPQVWLPATCQPQAAMHTFMHLRCPPAGPAHSTFFRPAVCAMALHGTATALAGVGVIVDAKWSASFLEGILLP